MRAFAYFLFLLLMTGVLSCTKDKTPDIEGTPDASFSESFDDAELARTKGWIFLNQSEARGNSNWRNPDDAPFDAYLSSSTRNGFLLTDYNATSIVGGTISNWLISPVIRFQNGDTINFYTRAQIFFYNNDSSDFVNRLQVRINLNNVEYNPGSAEDAGDFNQLLLDINPQYTEFFYNAFTQGEPAVRLAYPHRWTKFTIAINGLAQPTEGRIGFRYFLEGGGAGGRGSSVGIDEFSYKQFR